MALPGQPPTPAPAASPVPPGGTSPATVAPDSQGLQMRGKIMAIMGMKALTQALGLLGAETPEGQAVVKMLALGGKSFGETNADLSAQEVKLMGEKVPPVSQPNEAQGAAFEKLAGMGMTPPAAPPGAGPAGSPAAPPTQPPMAA